ncbi:ATP-binding protein [Campylobacterota bacterium DY0563]
MKNLSIKAKLILLFIVIKVIPLLLIAYIAYEGALKLDDYIQNSTRYLFNQNKEIVINTANKSIEDSIKNLDKKSQLALERLSYEIANNVAQFLYERDSDIKLLSKLDMNQKVLKEFYESKNKDIIIHNKYIYDDATNTWINPIKQEEIKRDKTTADLKDNEKEFSYIDPKEYKTKNIPIYKEISYFDLTGKEIYKVSQIDEKLHNISNKKNTYINSEDYFKEIQNLKKDEIYVSDVIGEYVKTKVIGTFTKEKAKKANIEFEPEKYAYAGKENPVGKRFEGIIRFVTPVYTNGKKQGYVSLALDHEHIMQFTDTSNPTNISAKQDISDASEGNYTFMWDYEGRNISHARDYFITGFNKETGKREMPWLSVDIAEKYQASGKEINKFLKTYPTFEEQSLKKKPNIKQLVNDGNVGLDCRYLNFAPQCQGWMQVTKNGGFGSFIIYWSKVWKLTTAATIPYYTGKYGNTKRGFGFITLGANVDEFHAAANETKENVKNILNSQTNAMKDIVNENTIQVKEYIEDLINELTIVTFLMIVIIIAVAIWMSNYISKKISNLLVATKKFSNKELDYQIEISSNDEIGKLEQSFNDMAFQIKALVEDQKALNSHLEEKVDEKTKELQEINHTLEEQIEQRTAYLKETLQRAKKADEAKSVFLANMSHEIRTPLNAIIGFSDVLTQNKNLDLTIVKQLKIIHSSANTLLTIINDILDISKIESGNFEISIEETDIYFISEHVVELFSKRALEKHIKLIFNLDYKIPLCVRTDGVRVRQVLSNLLSNAIKFTPEKGLVTLNIFVLEDSGTDVKIRFEVIDTGIGIPKEKLQTVFEPFIQIDHKSNRIYEGTGLGLSICKHIIESLDSAIFVDSTLDEGTKFYFDLSFNTCEATIFESKDYLDKLNFKVLDIKNDTYHYIKRYLNIFGTINMKEEDYILVCPYKNNLELDKVRENYKNIPKLILLEYEDDALNVVAKTDEQFISLPFYASKVNDSLQELSMKNNTSIKEDTINSMELKGKILVAEDNSANQELISYILNSLNIDFELQNDGLKTFEVFKENKYDLILMDINMPVMDGIESFKAIRKYEQENNLIETPVIALTANAIKGDKEKFLSLGMNGYLSKPVNTEQLIELFNKFLKNSIEVKKLEEVDLEVLPSEEKLEFDTNKIMAQLGISESITNMIIEKFKKDIKKDMSELELFVKESNFQEVSQKAHYIKNSALNVCLDEVCEILEKLELEKTDEEEVSKLFKQLKTKVDSYL